jgi:hypothetical protein
MSVRPLYHYQLGIPREFRTDFGQLFLDYSFHARKAAKTDRYGEISLPEVLDTSAAMVIEVEGGLFTACPTTTSSTWSWRSFRRGLL